MAEQEPRLGQLADQLEKLCPQLRQLELKIAELDRHARIPQDRKDTHGDNENQLQKQVTDLLKENDRLKLEIARIKQAEEVILRSQRLQILGQMSGGVSHTISNLLQIAIGNANIAYTNLEVEEYDDIRANLEQILDSNRAATESVRRLSRFWRERPSSEMARKVVFDLSDAVREGLEMCKLWAKAKLEREKIEISQELDLSTGCHVEGDKEGIVELVFNLVKNAIEALPQGGNISVKTYRDEKRVVLRMQDNGVGIAKKNIEDIMQPFWTSKKYHAGMGLAVNREIIRRHGGTLGVKRIKPQGTAFIVKLPISRRPSKKVKAAPRVVSDRKLRILLIDDDRAVVSTLGKSLQRRGHTIFIAYSGPEGLDIVKKNRLDAIVCDLGMEGMNGWEVSQEVEGMFRKNKKPRPPFILLTGWGGQLAEEEVLAEPQVDRIAEKPITIPRLLEIVYEEVRKAQ